jgi:hypothetical protein
MCQRLVDRVTQSKQLMAVADPDLLVLFEDWLDELEAEVISLAQGQGALTPPALAEQLGLSPRGATFIMSKLHREGKLPETP